MRYRICNTYATKLRTNTRKYYEGVKLNIEHFSSVAVTISGGFFAGLLVGYALKKVVKVVALVVGLFLAGLAYLQYQQILNINWNKLQVVSQNGVTTSIRYLQKLWLLAAYCVSQ